MVSNNNEYTFQKYIYTVNISAIAAVALIAVP